MKKISIIIIPPGSSDMIKFRVSKLIFGLLVLFLTFVIIYSVWLAVNFSTYVYQKEKNKKLSERYEQLVKEREQDKKKLKKIKKELADLEGMVSKISNIIGIDINKKLQSDEKHYNTYEKKWIGDKLKEYNYVTRDSYLNLATPKFVPVSGWISSRFDYRKSPFTGKREFHAAVDIVAPESRVIRSSSNGKVISIKEDSVMGKVLYIYNKWGYVSVYAHNKKIYKDVGDEVAIGEKIAEVGVSGNTTGPHLHYQLELLNIPINPEKYGMNMTDKKILNK